MNAQHLIGQTVAVDTINGLPAHILIVHFVVVGVPLAALLLILSALWPAARRRLGLITPIVGILALISVPVATHAGEWLYDHLLGAQSNPLVRRHTQLGDELLPWVIGLAVAAVAVWLLPFLAHRLSKPALDALPVRIAVAVVAVGFSVVSVVQVVRIGEAGSRATYNGVVCAVPISADNSCSQPLQ